MSSSYSELRYFEAGRRRNRTASHTPAQPEEAGRQEQPPPTVELTASADGIISLEPALAQQTCQRLDLASPDKAGDRLLLAHCQEDDPGAFLCLRCHVSQALELKARDLVAQFSPHTGLELHEIASFALLDRGESLSFIALRQQPEDRILPFTAQVICSYDPQRGAGLPHWAKYRLNSYEPLKDYLRDAHGLLLISDWALLADSSPTRMRKAWSFLPKSSLTLEQVIALHAGYKQQYRQDRQAYRQRHGRSGGYEPSDALILALLPPQESIPKEELSRTRETLREMARAIRRYLSPGWQKGLQQLSDDSSHQPLDPLDTLPDPRGLQEPDQESPQQLDQIRTALNRALDRHMPAVIAPAAHDPLLLCLWHGFAAGLTNRINGPRCGCSAAQVSRKLKPVQQATTVARWAAHDLSRLPAFDAVAASPEGAERLVEALRNQLLSPEQTDDVTLPDLKQWLQRHLPPQ